MKDVESARSQYYDEDSERSGRRNAVLDIPITDFELSVRSRNCLKKMNIRSLGDLLKTSEQELLAYKNFGETSLNEIKALLAQKGLRLGQTAGDGAAGPASAAMRRPVVAAGNAPPEILAKGVADLELSVRSRKALQRLNINSLGELASRTEDELLGCKNFGQTSLNEIKQQLAAFGMSLRKLEE
jgi:DNA-directed RNA polymerase subunit alpha